MHDLTIITMLAAALGAAVGLGWATQRLGLSPLVGYLLAGVVVGPATPGFVANATLASQLAELGVILLMFGVGLHFHPRELVRVWRIALPGALIQSAVATAFGVLIAVVLGWSLGAGLIFGLTLAVASTVVLMRMLDDQGALASPHGHVAVGWLIVEDLLTVVALVVLPLLLAPATSAGAMAHAIAFGVGKVALFVGVVALAGPRVVAFLLDRIAASKSRELFTLAVFVLALSIAALAANLVHVSVALGAFLAGLVVGQARAGDEANASMLPFRDVFSALFFVSVGMLFQPRFVVDHPGATAAALGVVLVIKPLITLIVVRVLRGEAKTATTVAFGLAQIGEFSFILGSLGRSLGVLPEMAFQLLVSSAIFSIAINPLLYRLAPRLERWLDA